MIDLTARVYFLSPDIDAMMQTLDKIAGRPEFEFWLSRQLGKLLVFWVLASLRSTCPPAAKKDEFQPGYLMILPAMAAYVPKRCFMTRPPSPARTIKKKH